MLVLLFDIDGTLVRTGGAGKAAMEAALQEEFGITEFRDVVPYSGRTDLAIGRDLLEVHGLAVTEANRQRLQQGYLRRLPHFLAKIPGRVCPGIAELIAALRQHDRVQLGLLTGNVRHGAELKLNHYQLWHHFAFGGFGDGHTDRDDVARSALASATNHLRQPPSLDRVWVIGDTPLDVSCARAIGARALAVATGWCTMSELEASQPDALFPDLSDVSSVLRLWQLP